MCRAPLAGELAALPSPTIVAPTLRADPEDDLPTHSSNVVKLSVMAVVALASVLLDAGYGYIPTLCSELPVLLL